ncbi:protein FAR-RED IMPAIRED RESPONSE 1-like isoform X1 [Olea europaea var. sylvestris]|uniref:protein FAR-RED IMPAIRED RESPONSE 1-like isoform X1 n=1 Tax=Olea europaea var. sylvestris TaxID=158386 RepID=UPI000C1D8915|nr:protein FAR-RED IMPAIRED RESPONSE 1-like isoform X1 [Olea europaea var. sylvestris]
MRCRYLASPSGRGDYLHLEIRENVTEELVLEFDTDNVAENVIKVEEETLGHNGPIVLEVSMMFNNDKELFDFYKRYTYNVGFPVQKRNSKKGDDGPLKYVILTCSHEGRKTNNANSSLNQHPINQTDCKAMIFASSANNGMWRINIVHLDHNHRTSPYKSRLYRCNRELSATVK